MIIRSKITSKSGLERTLLNDIFQTSGKLLYMLNGSNIPNIELLILRVQSRFPLLQVVAIYLCVLSLFFIGTHAYAYPSTKTGDRARLLEEIVKTSPVDVHRPIVLYDNINYRSDHSTDDLPVFDKGCACLVPAGVINVNLNMTYLFHSPAPPPRDLLGSLIYANIELKNMLEQYKEIQKRAVEIAEAAGSPAYVDSPYSIYMPLPEVVIHAAVGEKTNQSNPKLPKEGSSSEEGPFLSTALRRVENSIGRALFFARNVATGQPFTDQETNKEAEAHVKDSTNISVSSVALRSAVHKKFIDLTSRTYNIRHFSTEYSQPLYSLKHEKHVERPYAGDNSQDLPWLIDALFQFIPYCMHNKIEAAFIFIILIFFIKIANVIFRR